MHIKGYIKIMQEMNKYCVFNKNLLGLSDSTDIEEAKQEWYFICREDRDDATGTCLCQHKIKHINYLYNKKTKKSVCVGSSCYKKFNFSAKAIEDSSLQYVLKQSITRGEYDVIHNVLEYSLSIKEQLLELLQRKFDKVKYQKEKRWVLLNEIKNLICDYGLTYLGQVCEDIEKQVHMLDESDELNRHVEAEKLRMFKEQQSVKASMNANRLDRLSYLLDHGVNEMIVDEGSICSRCDEQDANGKHYNNELTGNKSVYRCADCAVMTDHWMQSAFREKAFIL
jgi:hypothetical protein